MLARRQQLIAKSLIAESLGLPEQTDFANFP
jgi:hypothetical protein